MKRCTLVSTFLFVVITWATPATAQIVNPTNVSWDHVDFASAARYDGGYFLLPVKADNTCDLTATPAVAPVQTDNLGKPATTTGTGMGALLVSRPIGCYVYKVRALDASGLYSPWSTPSDPFVRTPAAPGKPVVR